MFRDILSKKGAFLTREYFSAFFGILASRLAAFSRNANGRNISQLPTLPLYLGKISELHNKSEKSRHIYLERVSF